MIQIWIPILLGLNLMCATVNASEVVCAGGEVSDRHTRVQDLEGGYSEQGYDGYVVIPTGVGRTSFSISPNGLNYHFLIRQVITGQTYLNINTNSLIRRFEVVVDEKSRLFIECWKKDSQEKDQF